MEKGKRVLYVDMDNVLVDFASGIARVPADVQGRYKDRLDEVPGIFALMEPLPGPSRRITPSPPSSTPTSCPLPPGRTPPRLPTRWRG